jgi:hypothetical protein
VITREAARAACRRSWVMAWIGRGSKPFLPADGPFAWAARCERRVEPVAACAAEVPPAVAPGPAPAAGPNSSAGTRKPSPDDLALPLAPKSEGNKLAAPPCKEALPARASGEGATPKVLSSLWCTKR